jgi:hypothetical protein
MIGAGVQVEEQFATSSSSSNIIERKPFKKGI